MDEEARKRFEKLMRSVHSPLQVKVDEALIDLKRLYDAMREEDKKVLKAWIEKVVPLEQSPAGNLQGRLQVELKYSLSQDEDINVKGVPALAIRNAIEQWELGEFYTPETLGELGMG